MNPMVFTVIFSGYFISFLLYFINFESQNEAVSVWAKRVVMGSLLCHFLYLVIGFMRTRAYLVANLSEYIEMVSFIILFVSFVMESRFRAKFLMLFSLPIVLIFCLFAIVLSEQQNVLSVTGDSGWLWIHIGLILVGFSGLIIAVSSALMYLLQSSQLKSKRLGRAFLKLPSLNTLDRMHFISLSWGVILFSLGLLMGLFWAKTTHELKQVMKDPTVVLSFLTCFMYWVILSFRLSALRRGQKIAVGTLFVFALLFLTLFTSNVAPTGFHRGF